MWCSRRGWANHRWPFECTVTQIVELGSGPGAGHMLVCEVQRVHIAEDVVDGPDGKARSPTQWTWSADAAGNYYVRASG